MPGLRRYLAAGRDVTVDAVTWRPGRTTSENTYLAARTLHRHTAGRSSRVALAALRGRYASVSVPRPADLPSAWRAVLDGIDEIGVSYAPPVLDDAAVSRIREFAMTAPAVLRSTTGERRRGTLADRDETTAAVTLVEQFVLDQQDIQSLIANPDVHRLAAARFRMTPVMTPPSLYWSCVGAQVSDEERRNGARQFHWDYDGLSGLRLHLYLTDVDASSAPMSYIAGSHRPGGLRSAALRSADLGVSDDDLWAEYPRDALRVMTGPAGTTFISDSMGLHSGSDALTSDRLFLVMPIQASGFGGYQLRPRRVTARDPLFARALDQDWPEFTFFTRRAAADREPRGFPG